MMLHRRAASSKQKDAKPGKRAGRRLLPGLAILVLTGVLSVVWLHCSALLSIGSGNKLEHIDMPRTIDGAPGRRFTDKAHEKILTRAPSRIPGYLSGSSETYFGYVMRDFSSRVMSRHVVGGADVLIVSKDLEKELSATTAPGAFSLDNLKHQNSVGMSFCRHARQEGHRVHGFSALHGNWWENMTETCPSWILLAVFDPPYGEEDTALTDAKRVFSESTVTYVVFRVMSSESGHRGALAVTYLEELGYKVQLLSASHILKGYGPNKFIHKGNVINFLKAGRGKAMKDTGGGKVFTSYLFATQGLDLAIPSAREHLASGYFGLKNGRIVLPFKPCPASGVNVDFLSVEEIAEVGKKEHRSPEEMFISNFRVVCGKNVIVNPSNVAHFWMSHDTPELAEAVCVRLKSPCRNDEGVIMIGKTACATRILPVPSDQNQGSNRSESDPNLLVVMIDPISRPLFEQSLPNTKALLKQLGFTAFRNHSIVGDNSGPNQAALYAGRSLSKREDIASSDRRFSWIWDDLNDAGYVTYKAEDGCVRNSNMIQSIQPNTTHGSVIHEMMCFDFARPNCVGGKAAATQLAEHAGRFIETYSRRQQKWAAFVHFIDSHEDTNMLAVTLDDPIFSLLYGLRTKVTREVFDNTFIVLLSDHGLHYGSFLQSRQGKKERASPVLFMKPPRRFTEPDSVAAALLQNHGMWTTPFDVYATIRQVMLEENSTMSEAFGLSLLNPLPPRRLRCRETPIPGRYCDLFEELDLSLRIRHSEMVAPPSMLSFYADIPNSQKARRLDCPSGDTQSNHHLYNIAFPTDCLCATSHRNWYTCRTHPWQRKRKNSTSVMKPQEYFAFVDCPEKPLHVETRVERDPAILRRLSKMKSSEKNEASKPNVLFIELDSASINYADRHFPKTRELLKGLRIQSESDSFGCASNVCAADFTWFSITGPNSITNQVSALSGCLTIHHTQKCNNNTKSVVCKDEEMLQYGLRLYKRFSGATIWCPPSSDPKKPQLSPWLFDVAKREGYVTFFGEEFCYDSSPYVTQDNVFPLKADIMLHQVHCRLVERLLRQNGEQVDAEKLWMSAGDGLKCVDGHAGIDKSLIPLEHIRSMWDTYSDKPKFAFLNSIAAHDYSEVWSEMSLAAEAYDEMFVAFLEHMISRDDANQTIIVIRADHGLQGGPTTVEFSTQIEHPRPWTEIVVPKSLAGLSLKHLSLNQDKLVTGFDLYRMMRDVMSPTEVLADALEPGTLPSWAINVLNTEVPKSRSCKDARVASDFCRNELERISVAPAYGTCNLYEKRLAPYCLKSSEERVEAVTSLVTDKAGQLVRAAVDPPANIVKISEPELKFDQSARIVCNLSDAAFPKSNLRGLWNISDQFLTEHTGSKVSGGIFLYPRQQAMMVTILQHLSSAMVREHGRALRVCETGFGAGHSASLFLDASQNVTVVSFDKFDRPYQRPIAMELIRQVPGRFRWFEGDSCATVRRMLSPRWNPKPGGEMIVEKQQEVFQCDVLHGSSLCPSDNIDLVLRSPRGSLLTSTAMESLTDKAVYFGEKAQWRFLRTKGCINDITCFEEDETLVGRELHFKRAGEKIQHKFCMAFVTGKCTRLGRTIGSAGSNHPLYDLSRSLNLMQMCPSHQVDVPE